MTHVGVRDSSGRFIETFEIFAKLPGPGWLVPISVRHSTTVGELKTLIELTCGVPTDLQRLSYHHHAVLVEQDTLGTLCVLPGARVLVKIAYRYERLVEAALTGDLQEVLKCVSVSKDAVGMARRRFIAMFVAAHKGYHYMVDRMLREGVHPDSQTPSGRTALHVACATGNTGCLDSLLQHGASILIKDVSGKTPADAAISSGQQSTQRHLLLYSRILANTPDRERPYSWTRSSRLLKPKLGSSAAPSLSLEDLTISPGPELMITAWNGRKQKRSRSAKGLVFHTVSSSSPWGNRSRDDHHIVTSSSENSVLQHHKRNDKKHMAQSVGLNNNLLKSSLTSKSNHLGRAKSSPSKTVKFALEDPSVSLSMSKQSSSPRDSVVLNSGNSSRQSTQPSSPTYKTTESLNTCFDEHRDLQKSTTRELPIENVQRQGHEILSEQQKKECIPANVAHNRNSVRERHDTDIRTEDDACSDSSSGSNQEDVLKELGTQRISYVNDKLRSMVGLPLQYPQRLEFMKEEENKDMYGSSLAVTRTRKATPEENEQAFKDWLASKTRDNRGKTLEQNCPRKKKTPLSFESWSERKFAQERLRSARMASESAKQEEREREQRVARLSKSGTAVEAWMDAKLKKQRHEKLAKKHHEMEQQQLKEEQMKAAQDVFKKWCMQKQWEELQILKGGQSAGRKRRPKSGNAKLKELNTRSSTRRNRSHSAPPRRLNAPAV